MSYTIEYSRQLYRADVHGGLPHFFLLIKSGDNNVISHNGHRVREWYLAYQGEAKGFWPNVGMRAGCCQGGGLQRASGWRGTAYCSVEKYIALYRKTFRTAKPAENMLTDFSVSLKIELRGTKESEMGLEHIKIAERRGALETFLNRSEAVLVPGEDWYYKYKKSTANITLHDLVSLQEALTLVGEVASSVEGFNGFSRLECSERGH